MTEKEKIANAANLSTFTRNHPMLAIILALVFIPLFPLIYTSVHFYLAIKEADIFKYFFDDWKRMINLPNVLIKYIKAK